MKRNTRSTQHDKGGQKESLRTRKAITTQKKQPARVRKKDDLTILNRLVRTVTAQLSLQDVCDAVVQEISVALGLEVVALFTHNGDGLQIKAVGPTSSYLQAVNMPVHKVGECLCGLAAHTGRLICSQNIHRDKRCTWTECKKAGLSSFAALPLSFGDEPLGVLGLASKGKRNFKEESPLLRTVANLVSISIHNARLFEQRSAYSAQLERHIAERTKIEEALRAQEEHYHALFNAITDAVFVHDVYKDGTLGTFIEVNSVACERLGYTRQELLAMSPQDIDAPDSAVDLRQISSRVRAGERVTFEQTHIAKNGRRIPVEIHAQLFSLDSHPVVLSLVRDIAEQKQANESIKWEKQFSETLLESLPGLFYLYEIDMQSPAESRLIRFNRKHSLLTGYTPDELRSMKIKDWFEPDVLEEAVKAIGEVARNGEAQAQLMLRIKDGLHVPYFFTGRFLNIDEKSYFLGMGLDVSEYVRIQETLQQERDFSAGVIEGLPGIFFVIDQVGRFVRWNRLAEEVTGYSGKEISCMRGREFIDPREGKLVSEKVQEFFLHGKADMEASLLTKSGRTIPYYFAGWKKELDGHFYLIGFGVDITGRKRAEEELLRKTGELDLYFTSALDLLCIADVKGFFRKLNPSWEDTLGYPLEELQESRFLDFVHPDDLEATQHAIAKLSAQETVLSFTNRYRHKDGTYRWIEWRAFPRGELIYAVARDITKRKLAEEALRVSEEKYRLVVENANDAIVIVQDGMIKFPNHQSVVLSGYTEKELINIPFSHFLYPDDKDMVMEKHRQRLRGDAMPATYAFRFINKAGETLWVEASAVLITWEGRPATLSFLRDITVQKKLEEQLLQAQKMEAVGQLAGGVAHDFNNLLTAIVGYGHLLRKEASKDARLSAYVVQILGAAERAAILTNDLLTFSRKQVVNLQPVNLNRIIKNMESLLSRVIGEDIELSTVLADTDLTIMADSAQIDQILMNLATNAQDAMPTGGSLLIRTDRVEINGEYIKAYSNTKPGPYALLSVEDTGIGMDEKIRGRIFEPFFTTKKVGKGTGLGLAMVYGIVKQHDGYINVYSEPGRGSTFKILLPLVQSKGEAIKPEHFTKVKGGTETILVGEDDPQVRTLLKEVLSDAGYHVIEAIDGGDAVEVFHANKASIHLLIFDVIMPRKNGKEAYKEIKKVKPDIKAIFVSGYSEDIIHKKGILEVGLNFLSKPVSPDELLLKVREVLDQ